MKANILLVDSYLEVRDSLSRSLRWEGYDLTIATNGQPAVGSLRRTGFDLVLLNVDNSICQGWDILGQIITNCLSLPLIILTKDPVQQLWTSEGGVEVVLQKPFEIKALLDVVHRVLPL